MQIIVDKNREYTKPLSLASICQAVCEHYDIREHELRGVRRHKRLAHARHIFCHLAYEYTNSTMSRIGHFLKRDHTTIIHALRKIDNSYQGDVDFQEMCVSIAKEAHEIDEAKRQELAREVEKLHEVLGVGQLERESRPYEEVGKDNRGTDRPARRLSGRVCEIRKTDKGDWVYPQ